MKDQTSLLPSLPKRLSLVAQTVDSLQEGIEKGLWQDQLPGERELCESLQVSRRTLRAALDELQRKGSLEVSSRQRRRIKNQPNEPVTDSDKKVVAVLLPGSFLSLPSRITFVMDSLRSKLTAADCEVRFHVQPTCYTANPARALAKFTAEHPASVWLVLSALEPMQRWFNKQPLSTIILGSCAPGIDLPSVDVDFRAACHHAGGLLWRKGHRHIAIVLFKGIYGGDIASEEGLRDALKEMPGANVQVIRHNNETASLCAKLDDTLRSPNPPSAYLVGGANHVITVMMHLMRRGKRIPQDVAVISRDNDSILESASPTVAHYATPPAQLAARITLAIRQLIETDTALLPQIRLMPTFMPGESV